MLRQRRDSTFAKACRICTDHACHVPAILHRSCSFEAKPSRHLLSRWHSPTECSFPASPSVLLCCVRVEATARFIFHLPAFSPASCNMARSYGWLSMFTARILIVRWFHAKVVRALGRSSLRARRMPSTSRLPLRCAVCSRYRSHGFASDTSCDGCSAFSLAFTPTRPVASANSALDSSILQLRVPDAELPRPHSAHEGFPLRDTLSSLVGLCDSPSFSHFNGKDPVYCIRSFVY